MAEQTPNSYRFLWNNLNEGHLKVSVDFIIEAEVDKQHFIVIYIYIYIIWFSYKT